MPKAAEDILILENYIKEDNVKSALRTITDAENFDLKIVLRCLGEVQLLVYRAVNKKQLIRSTSDDIHDLAEKCLSVIEASDWNVDHLKFLTYIFHVVNYLLTQNKLFLAKNVCSYITKWKQHKNGNKLTDAEKNILQKIYKIFTVTLYNTNIVNSGYEKNEEIHLFFELWTFTFDIRKYDDEVTLKDTITTFGMKISKFESLGVNLTESIHLKSLEYLIKRYIEARVSITDIDDTFSTLVRAFTICVKYSFKMKRYKELTDILDCIKISKELFTSAEYVKCLSICEKFVTIVIADILDVDSDVCSLLEDCNRLIEELFSRKRKSLNAVSDILYVTLSNVQFKFTSVEKYAFPHLYSLILHVYNMEEQPVDSYKLCILENGDPCSIKIDNRRIIGLFSASLSQVDAIYKCTNSRLDVLVSIYKYIEKMLLSALRLWTKACQANCPSKIQLESLIKHFTSAIHNYSSLELHKEGQALANTFMKYLFSNSSDFTKVTSNFNMLTVLACYCYCCRKLNQVKVGLLAIVALICIDPTSTNACFKEWSIMKLSKCCTKEKCTTFLDILKESKEELMNEWKISASLMSTVDVPLILLSEMKVYYKQRSLQVGPLMKAWTALLSLKPPLLITAKGHLFIMDAATKDELISKELYAQRKEIMDQLSKQVSKGEDQFQNNLVLGNLLHYNALSEIYSIRTKTKMQLIRWKIEPAKQQLDEAGMVPDPTESLDPIADSAIAFSKQLPVLAELDKALHHIKAAFMKEQDLGDDFNFYLDITLANIKLIAQFYTLYCDYLRAESTWRLLYTLSEKFSNQKMCVSKFSYQKMCVSAVSNLLKLQSQIDPEWVNQALQISSTLSESSTTKQFFYICLARNCIVDFKLIEAVKHLEKVGTVFTNNIIQTFFLLTLAQGLVLPSFAASWNGTPSTASVALYQAFCCLYYVIKRDDCGGSTDHCVLEEAFFETLMYLGHRYGSLMIPRTAYYYLNEQVGLVQKLALPIRTARLLVPLTWVDAYVHKLDDCELKLDNLLVILGLKRKYSTLANCKPRSPLAQRSPPNIIIDASSPVRDVAVSSLRIDSLSLHGSPDLYGNNFSKIMVHSSDCSCSSCHNSFFLCLTVDVMILNAVLSCLRKQHSQAMKHFEDVIKLIDQLDNKVVNAEWLKGRKSMLYYHYSEMLVTVKDCNAALSFSHKAVEQLKSIEVASLSTSMDIVSGNLVCLQKEKLLFSHVLNRYRKNSIASVSNASKNVVNDVTPMKSTAGPSRPPASTRIAACNISPNYDHTPNNIARRPLHFDSDNECSGKENGFVSPLCISKRITRKTNLPSFVSKIPTVTVAKENTSICSTSNSRQKSVKKEIPICKDKPKNKLKENFTIGKDLPTKNIRRKK